MRVERYYVVHLKLNVSEMKELNKFVPHPKDGNPSVDKNDVLNCLFAIGEVAKNNNLVKSFNSLVERRSFGLFCPLKDFVNHNHFPHV
ncbi:hypothetical protein HS7_12090 [Sulfolobales archaeon HS-7]|nr:hypothetical protein HS7_12090 [Sulfolobales archaeon HS-7]